MKAGTTDSATMSLPAAARALGLSWGQAWRLVLMGRLSAQQNPRGRYRVMVASVRALQKKAGENGAAVARVS